MRYLVLLALLVLAACSRTESPIEAEQFAACMREHPAPGAPAQMDADTLARCR